MDSPLYRAIFINLLLVLSRTARADVHFSLPGDSFTDRTRLTEITATLEQKQFPAAATLFDALLAEDGEKLMSFGEGKGSLISVSVWADGLTKSQVAALQAAYREKFDAPVAAQLDAMRRDSRTTVAAMYALARRYRFCPTAGLAYADAADRSIEEGDLSTAYALYQLAQRAGWSADESRAARFESLRRFDEGVLTPLPAETGAVKAVKPYAGLIPFDATWFNSTNSAVSRYFPVAGDDRIFVCGPTGAAAFREGGQILWSSPAVAIGSASTRPVSRGPIAWQPALLHDIYGRGQILVTRQLLPQSDLAADYYVLHAVRAADGRPIWASESQPLLKDLSFAGTPVIAGRYTYALAIAVQTGGERATLSLVALDTMTGQLRWQATLGNFDHPRGEPTKSWDAIWSQSEPLVAGDGVYIAPGCGVIACVGRLDGKLRWLHSYETGGALPTRWRNTPALCGSVLIAAPRDTPNAIGLDAATGKPLWSVKPEAPSLIGSGGAGAIFAGPDSVISLSARDGRAGWRWEPSRTNHITGPAVVNDGLVIVPTTAPMTSLKADTGEVAQREATGIPLFRRALNADVARHALEDLGGGKSFGK